MWQPFRGFQTYKHCVGLKRCLAVRTHPAHVRNAIMSWQPSHHIDTIPCVPAPTVPLLREAWRSRWGT